MTHEEAARFLSHAALAGRADSCWFDLGAGTGTFTRALAEQLGAGTVIAVDTRKDALAKQQTTPDRANCARIQVLQADFEAPLPASYGHVDGILMANALHYVKNQQRLLAQLMLRIASGGQLLIIEYNDRRANPWVPYPVPYKQLERLCAQVGLGAPEQLAEMRSRFGGTLYLARIRVGVLGREG